MDDRTYMNDYQKMGHEIMAENKVQDGQASKGLDKDGQYSKSKEQQGKVSQEDAMIFQQGIEEAKRQGIVGDGISRVVIDYVIDAHDPSEFFQYDAARVRSAIDDPTTTANNEADVQYNAMDVEQREQVMEVLRSDPFANFEQAVARAGGGMEGRNNRYSMAGSKSEDK